MLFVIIPHVSLGLSEITDIHIYELITLLTAYYFHGMKLSNNCSSANFQKFKRV